ncbi:Protein of unknown function (DUF1679) [Nesidiocoris tenuis]|nr:Protein of unknown function (DUF1679) [Nesidiocoris tenuis]
MDTDPGLDTKWLGRLLKQRFHDDKPVDVLNVNVEPAVPKGEGYTSDIFRVRITTLSASGTTKTFSMIVKRGKNFESNEHLGLSSVFRNESKMYSSTLKHMEDLMNEFDDKRDILWPKLYGFKPYSNMVLEDIKDQSYQLMDRKNWLGLDHALLVLRGLGRYHAMTRALIERGLIGPDDKGNFWATELGQKLIAGSMAAMSKTIVQNRGSWTPKWTEIGKRLQAMADKMPHLVGQLYENYDKKFEVLNHGDLWTSNMMFRLMEYTDIPISVKFLDFQLSHMNSFIWDVMQFICEAVKPSVRRANKDRLLIAYHQSLSENLKFFKCAQIPTIEDVFGEEKRIRHAQLTFIAISAICISSVDGAFNLDKLVGGNFEEAFNPCLYEGEKYVSQIGDDLEEFERLGVI